MVTTVPAGPVSGQNDVTEGRTVSGDAEATLAPVVRIAIGPLTASAGTVAVICVAESRVKVTVAAEPAKPIAPKGVPTISGWKLNRDGSISGRISGSSNFRDGEQVTTSPIAQGRIESGSTVKTGSGSRYFLG